MSGGLHHSGGASIPSSVRKMIQNIKEIAGNHHDDEIYAMLKECNMDPNETTQKLLLQDTFHEVRRKRDKRKENLNNTDSGDSRWRPGLQGRGGRSGKGGYSPRYPSHDAGGGRNFNAGKENGAIQGANKGPVPISVSASSQTAETKADASVSSSKPELANGPASIPYASPESGRVSQETGGTSGAPPSRESSHGDTHGLAPQSSDKYSPFPASVSGVYSSASDPVLLPSLDYRIPGALGTIKREVGSQRIAVDPNNAVHESKLVPSSFAIPLQINQLVSHDVADSELSTSMSEKVSPEIGSAFFHGTAQSKSQGIERNHLPESTPVVSSSSNPGSSVGRPPSNYGARSQQQLNGSQKAVGPSKEWKPKPTNPNPTAPGSGSLGATNADPSLSVEGHQSQSSSDNARLEEANLKLQKKMEELQVSDDQHVIIPNHLQVPEAERTGLSFGSFEPSFGVGNIFVNDHDSDKSSSPLSESSQGIEEPQEEPPLSISNAAPTGTEGNYMEHSQSPGRAPEMLSSGETDVSQNVGAVPQSDASKPDVVLAPGGPQYSVVQNGPNFSSFGLMPPMLGSQFASFESGEPQARDVSRLPGFIVQQPFDPATSYYTPFYRPGADGDARFAPFLAPGTATKFNGNIAVLSTQSGPSSQESANSMVVSSAGPTPLATQAAGVMQSSIAVTQQPVPVFRQPAGVHISHYPSNYLPYNQYFSPVYVPPPTIHHFLSNTPFPQQPPSGSSYPPPQAGATVKYSLSQYKPGSNSGNSTHIGMPAGYGNFGGVPSGYSASAAATSGNSASNEELGGSQYKENNVYITGQQGEGSAMWFPAPGRDISTLQASSFYSLPQAGQHVTFGPTQAGLAGLYHPGPPAMAAPTAHPLMQQAQTMAGPVGPVGPQAGVYQNAQRPQVNWANNY
ncbi:hypothetical protein AMTRI_Chr10g232330 [Amborella trichopoda]